MRPSAKFSSQPHRETVMVDGHREIMHPVVATGARDFMKATVDARSEKFPIGELSKCSGVNIETIRYYERIKLMSPPPRTANGRRVYESSGLRTLVFIRRSRELGFSLDEIRTLLRLGGPERATCREVRDVAAHHLEDVRSKLRDLQ